MITIFKLVAVLFHIITIIQASPAIPQEAKQDIVNQIVASVTQDISVPDAPVQAAAVETSAPSSTSNPFIAEPVVVTGNSIPASLPASTASAPAQLVNGTISIAGQPNSDGSYSVMAQMNDASSLLVEVVNVAHNDDFKARTSSNNEVFTLYDKGDWTYTVTSYDRNNTVMGVSSGNFTIN